MRAGWGISGVVRHHYQTNRSQVYIGTCMARADKDREHYNLYIMPRKYWEGRHAVHVALNEAFCLRVNAFKKMSSVNLQSAISISRKFDCMPNLIIHI
jgi:hypothetical protein